MARRGKVLDKFEWTGAEFVRQAVSTATTVLGGSLSTLVPFTMVRMRGYVQAHFDATKQLDDRIVLTFGFGLFSTDAVTLGATALPDPSDEKEFPWLWWNQMALESEISAAGEGTWGMNAQRIDVDSKAMRKVKPGQSLAWVVQATDLAGAPVTLVTTGATRILIGT